MTLHILNQPAGHPATSQMMAVIQPHDHLILIEEAVTAILSFNDDDRWQSLVGRVSVLYEDLKARGLASQTGRSDWNGFKVIDISEFVELTAAHSSSISWH